MRYVRGDLLLPIDDLSVQAHLFGGDEVLVEDRAVLVCGDADLVLTEFGRPRRLVGDRLADDLELLACTGTVTDFCSVTTCLRSRIRPVSTEVVPTSTRSSCRVSVSFSDPGAAWAGGWPGLGYRSDSVQWSWGTSASPVSCCHRALMRHKASPGSEPTFTR